MTRDELIKARDDLKRQIDNGYDREVIGRTTEEYSDEILWALSQCIDTQEYRMQTHEYVPDPQFPWFCQICGYGEKVELKHGQDKK
jgi:hypothetical protein